jgi:hypothetical protein
VTDLDARIRDAVADLPGIAVLVLFGSRARGTARPDSDLDVAVLTAGLEAAARWQLRLTLAARLAPLTSSGRVDVVVIEEAPELLRHRIMRDGRVLRCDDAAAWHEWKVRTLREHGDREWARRLLREALRARLEKGDFGGRPGRALASPGRMGRLPR